MNDLQKYFVNNQRGLIFKWKHYFEIYERHFSRFRNTEVHIVEIGVLGGGSLQMWKEYFGPKAKVYGVDINPKCSRYKEDQIDIFIGNAEDKGFLKMLTEKIPIDILIDDGAHTMEQQIIIFEGLFNHISPHGVYLCEDTFSSYQPRAYGGGYKKFGTYIEYTKNFIDYIHAWHSGQDYFPKEAEGKNKLPPEPYRLPVSDFTRSVHSLHYYDSVVVIEKRPTERPFMVHSGKPPMLMSKLLKKVESYPADEQLFSSDFNRTDLAKILNSRTNLDEPELDDSDSE